MQTHWFRRRASRGILRSFLVFAAASASLLGGAVSSYARAADDAAFPRATAESQGLSGEALSELSNVVRELVERDAIVGGELLVIKNRRVVLHDVYGLTDRETKTAWAPNTICNIRSMTKTFTGAAAQLLIDRGRLALEDRVSKHLPAFDTDAAREITIDQLMTHRSGLPLSVLLTREDMTKYGSLQEQCAAVGERGPEFEPGSKFWYSDAGSDTLAAVVEKVSGTTIDEFWRTELFEPLGMRDTFVALDTEDERFARIAPLYAGRVGAWQRLWTPAEGPFYPFAWGSQTAYGTAQDYAKFLAMWMDRGKIGERTILSREAVERTLEPMTPMRMLGSDARFPTDFSGLEVWYGRMSVLHVSKESPDTAAPEIIGHSGSDGTIAWAWPDRDLMILLFTQSRGGTATLRLEDAIDRLLLHPERAASSEEVPERFRPMIGTYVANFATYRNEEFRVLMKNGGLALDIPSQMVFELIEPGADEVEKRWKFAIAPDAVNVTFEQQEDGVFDLLKVHQSGATFNVPRKGTRLAEEAAKLATVDPEKVKLLLGAYFHPEANANVTVLLEDDVLCLRAPQGVTFHFVPPEDGVSWTLKEAPGLTLTFEFDEQGRVVSMTRHVGEAKLVMERQRE
ncbi:MAG: serine hydrolase domain-containing protein [Phycisphaerales bacterium]